MRIAFCCNLLLFVPFVVTSSVSADEVANNWHQWRGPEANGVSRTAKPPVQWSENRNIRWKVKIDGNGSACPIVWGDKVFLLTALNTGIVDSSLPKPEDQPDRVFGIKYPNTTYQFVVLCLDRNTGDELWRRVAIERVPHEGHHHDNNFATASPTTDGKRLYCWFGSAGLFCYDLANGEIIWQSSGLTGNVIPSPVIEGDVVYCMSGYEGYSLLALRMSETGDISASDALVWSKKQGTPYIPSPLLYDGMLYFNQSNQAILTCVDASTGDTIISRTRLPGISNIYASPVGADGRVYITGRNGTTLVLERSGKLTVLAKNSLDDQIDSSPALAGQQLFLRGQSFLYCLEE